ncbi:MAG: hypothetical protein E6J73_17360 [Deltaproteobacteria bacterium]|nr:MAG: hypothetical protein E6J73_17360 [Deltaproteobacteria bacterium]
MREASKNWPSTEGRKNLLFYEDPDYGFAINGVVRVPGRKGSIHDHAHSWTAYGLLDGTESLERYRRLDDGSKEGYAKLELESVTQGNPGKVDLVPPFDAHAEQGGPTRSGEQHRAEDRWSDKYPVRDHRLDRFQPSCLFSTKITKDTKDSTSSPPRRRRRSERVQKINLCDLCVPAVKFLFSSLLAALPRCVLRGEIFRL